MKDIIWQLYLEKAAQFHQFVIDWGRPQEWPETL
jgi:hypothetical protein